jgi:hypothetical protein
VNIDWTAVIVSFVTHFIPSFFAYLAWRKSSKIYRAVNGKNRDPH